MHGPLTLAEFDTLPPDAQHAYNGVNRLRNHAWTVNDHDGQAQADAAAATLAEYLRTHHGLTAPAPRTGVSA